MANVSNDFKAGILVFVGLVFFVASIWVMGQERQIFMKQEEFFASFKDIGGLREGAAVRLSGISIGRISKIGFSRDLNDPRVYVTLLINETYLDRIRENGVALIETQGLLGDKYLDIRSDHDSAILPPGSTIKGIEPIDVAKIFDKAELAVDNFSNVAESINRIIEKGESETLDNLSKIVSNVASITEEIKVGSGLLHRLIYSKEDAETIIYNMSQASLDISDAAHSLKTTSDNLALGNGTLGALLVDPTLYNNLTEITDGAKRSFLLKEVIKKSLNK